jgi:transcriptional regulator with XRE-family HTH domain
MHDRKASRVKMKKKREPHPLNVAVKAVREAYGDTQERFAQRVGVAVMTISRFETGRAIPRDPATLMKLWRAARERALPEAELLREAWDEAAIAKGLEDWHKPDPRDARSVLATNLRQWFRLEAVNVAAEFYPELLPAIDEALAPVLELVLPVVNSIQELPGLNYSELRHRFRELANQQTLEELKKGRQ